MFYFFLLLLLILIICALVRRHIRRSHKWNYSVSCRKQARNIHLFTLTTSKNFYRTNVTNCIPVWNRLSVCLFSVRKFSITKARALASIFFFFFCLCLFYCCMWTDFFFQTRFGDFFNFFFGIYIGTILHTWIHDMRILCNENVQNDDE